MKNVVSSIRQAVCYTLLTAIIWSLVPVSASSQVRKSKPPIPTQTKTDKKTNLLVDSVGFPTFINVIEENVGNASITVERTGGDNAAFSVDYTTFDNGATVGIDYTLTQGTLNFAANETSKQIIVPIINDTDAEYIENVGVRLSNPTNGVTLGEFEAYLQIKADEPFFSIISSSSLAENDTAVSIPVERIGRDLSQSASVDFAMADNTAVAGQDYVATSGTITFAANEALQFIPISLIDDAIIESDENFAINLSNPTAGTTILSATGLITIQDNDAPVEAIAFVTDRDGDNEIYSINTNQSNLQNLTDDSGSNDTTPEYNATADKIVYDCNGNICAMNKDGSNRTTLYDSGMFDLRNPSWSADGLKIVVSTNTPNGIGVYTIASNSLATLSGPPLIPANPRFSPDGSSIVFVGQNFIGGQKDIWKVNSSGGGFSNLTNNSGDYFEPKWSPNGSKILFHKGTTGDIFTINSSGGSQTNLTNSPVDNDKQPQWSPDGTQIVFSSYVDDDGATYISLMNANGSSRQNLTDGVRPQFSPNGVKIAFNDATTLNVMDADGSNQTQLSNPAIEDIAPIWLTSATVAPPTVSFANSGHNVNEGDGSGSIEVRRNGDTSVAFDVNYSFTNGAAINGTDYTATNGTLNFAAGETSKIITFTIIDDSFGEPFEAFSATISNPTNGVTLTSPTNHDVFILDNEPTITLSATPLTLVEGGIVAVTLTRTGNLSNSSQVNFETLVNPADYINANQTVTFAANEATKTINVQTIDDNLGEIDEIFIVRIINPIAASLGSATQQTITITDNEPKVSFNPLTYTVLESAGNAVLTVVRTGDGSQSGTVNYVTGNSSAGGRFTPSNGTVTFNVGENSKTISIPIIDDTIVNSGGGIFFVQLQSPSPNMTVRSEENGFVYLIDNDTNIVIAPTSRNQLFNENSGNASITINRTGALLNTVSVDYATSPDTAYATLDYITTSGTLTFAPNETSKVVTIPIIENSFVEGLESFRFTLSNFANGAFPSADPLASVTNVFISDNDTFYSVSFENLSVNEGVGTANVVVTRSLGNLASSSASVDYDTANVSAIAPFDYTATSGTLTFAPNETSKAIVVPIIDDVASEQTESFIVRLLPSNTAQIGRAVNQVDIADNDPKISMVEATYQVFESAGIIAVGIKRIGPTTLTASVNYTTSNSSAVAGQDYTATSGTAVFNAGEIYQTINIPIIVDGNFEPQEAFFFTLSNPNGAILQNPTSSIVYINEPPQELKEFNLSVTKTGGCDYQTNPRIRREFDRECRWFQYFDYEATVTQTVTVTRRAENLNTSATVQYATSDNTALAGQDYTAQSGTLNFAPLETSKTFNVPISNDAINEGIESLNVTISNASNGYSIGKGTVPMEIYDSFGGVDYLSQIYPYVSEADGAKTITIARTGAADNAASFDYATVGGTATPDVDFTPISGTINFAIGETSKTISVPILQDLLPEGNETFTVVLSNPTGEISFGESYSSSIQINIQDDDTAQISIAVPTNTEPFQPYLSQLFPLPVGQSVIAESTATINVVIQKSGNTNGNNVSVDYSTENISAIAGQDYTAVNGTLTFTPSEFSKTISIPITNDSIADYGELFRIKLTNPQGSTSIGIAAMTIEIRDPIFKFSRPEDAIPNPSPVEGFSQNDGQYSVTESPGGRFAGITVVRYADLGETISVNYSTFDGTATAGQDYTATSGTLVFAPNERVKSFNVPILDDFLVEGNETVNLNLTLPIGDATLLLPQRQLVISDNNSIVSVSNLIRTVNEGDNVYVATINRFGNLNLPFTVDYVTANDTATAGNDYTATSGTLTFAAGQTSRSFSISIADDGIGEPSEIFKIILSNSTGETQIVNNASNPALITIIDSSPKVKFQFEAFASNEAATFASIGVMRQGNPAFPMSVDVATSNGTATAGNDYTATTATVNFAAGETVKYVNVPLLNDNITEGVEHFNLTLSNAVGTVIIATNPVRMNITEIKPQLQMPNWTLTVASSGGLLSGRHLAGIASNTTNKELYIATDTGQLQNTEEVYFDLFKVDTSGNQTQIGRYFIPHYDLVNLEFNSVDGQIYTVGTDKVVYRINPTTGVMSVFNSNIGVTFFRYGLEFNAANELIFMPENNPNSFYRVNAGSGLTFLGSVTADNNSNYGTRFGIQPDGDYVIYPDGTAASNPRITEINKTTFAFNYLSPTNVRTLGSAFGHSIGAVNPVTGDVFSSGGNFGSGSSVILMTNGASNLAGNLAGATVPFITKIGNDTSDGLNNLSAKGVTDMEFGPRRDNVAGQCLYFVDDVDETVYQACSVTPTAANATVSGRITTAGGRGIARVFVTLTDTETGETRRILSSQFGYYRFNDVEVGKSYVIAVASKRYVFEPNNRVITPNEDLTNADFIAENVK